MLHFHSLSVDVIKVSPNVTHHVREIMWKSMVYVGVDSTRRLVWCIPSATMTALFLSVLRSIQPSTPYERTLFILQPHLLDDLFAAVSYEIEAAGYKGAVFGYAEVCRRPEGELDPRGPRVSRKLSDHKAVDKLVSEHAPHAVIDAVNVTMAWLPPADIETANSEHVQPVSQPATALVSTWVSHTGVSWVDVEAGPFSWGSGTPGQSFHRKTQYLLDSGDHSTKWCGFCFWFPFSSVMTMFAMCVQFGFRSSGPSPERVRVTNRTASQRFVFSYAQRSGVGQWTRKDSRHLPRSPSLPFVHCQIAQRCG